MVVSSFMEEGRCQYARMEGVDDDDVCYMGYYATVQMVPLEAVMTQLCWEVSRLRDELAATHTQVSLLTAMLPHHLWPAPSAFAAQPTSGELQTANGSERAISTIALRKVSNKKIGHTTVTAATPHKVESATMDDVFGAKSHSSDVATIEKDFARRLLDERVKAYEQGAGPDDSGSASSETSEDNICIICQEPACYTCWSGCGPFCQMCHVVHTDDGRHWTL